MNDNRSREQILRQLRRDYLQTFPKKYQELSSVLEQFQSGMPDQQLPLDMLRSLVHRLSGSAGSYGFEDLSQMAIETEQLLHSGTLGVDGFAERVSDRVRQLLDCLEETRCIDMLD
jgi:HPt (histidine-containing phosphotransfer) domain-containing protein